jgi:uncharacterized membrane protein
VSPRDAPAADDLKETGRVEAFSDGVFAIAITLLVLDLKVPRELPGSARLIDVLLRQWPSYVAFVSSFATIGIMWINHHRLFALVRRVDHWLLILNGLLLLGVTFVPFPTALVAEYVQHHDQRVAAMVYTGTFVLIAVIFNLLWRHASRWGRLLHMKADPKAIKAIDLAYAFGPPVYLLAFIAAIFSAATALGLTILLALFFALPGSVFARRVR